MSGSIFGTFIGSAAGACSCGPIGFAVISTFGTVGATTTAFLTNYEIPIRIVAIVILIITYFTTIKSLKTDFLFLFYIKIIWNSISRSDIYLPFLDNLICKIGIFSLVFLLFPVPFFLR